MLIERQKLISLVRKFCPIFYLCRNEPYMPCSVEYFLKNSELVLRQGKEEKVLADRGSVTEELVMEHQERLKNHRDVLLILRLDPEARRGEDIGNDVPVYANVKSIRSSAGEFEALEITYITLFAFNGHYEILPGLSVGAHDGDIEHLSVRVDPTNGELIGVWFNSHRNHDGSWVAATNVERENYGRLVSYVALHGHGHYPRPGTVYRHFFLGNDRCEKGQSWSPNTVVLVPTYDRVRDGSHDPADEAQDVVLRLHECESRGSLLREEDRIIYRENNDQLYPRVDDMQPCTWWRFEGLFGDTEAPILQSWFLHAEPPLSRHPILRLFFHFWPETSRL